MNMTKHAEHNVRKIPAIPTIAIYYFIRDKNFYNGFL